MDCTERAILTDRTTATDRLGLRSGYSKGRESNLVRRIKNGSVEPYSPTGIDAYVWCVEM